MKQDGSIALFQYWNRLRDGRPAPKRTEIEPADIKTLLADTFILEKDARGESRVPSRRHPALRRLRPRTQGLLPSPRCGARRTSA